MSYVFAIDPGTNSAIPVQQSLARNEAKDLHELLARNPHILPGRHISDGDDLKWLLIKSEIPVPGPTTGNNQWSLDLLFADHLGVPTLIECKKYLNTQSRREVVGQMFEYVANARHYWTGEYLRRVARETHLGGLDAKLGELHPDIPLDEEGFFSMVEANLRKGKVRLIFFLDQAPNELRSIVEFLNDQLREAEVLIVEAKQYELRGGSRIIVPSLFGYTERARVERAAAAVQQAGRDWTEETFFEAVRRNDASIMGPLHRLYGFLRASGAEIWWGRSGTASFNVAPPLPAGYPSPRRSFLTATSTGLLRFNLGYMEGLPGMGRFAEALRHGLSTSLQFRMPEQWRQKYPSVSSAQWIPEEAALISLLGSLLTKNWPTGEEREVLETAVTEV